MKLRFFSGTILFWLIWFIMVITCISFGLKVTSKSQQVIYPIYARIILIAGWLYFLYGLAKSQKWSVGLVGVLYLGFVSIILDMLPLKVGYSLPCSGCDKAAYVAQAMTYTVGNPFGEDFAYQGIAAIYSPIYPYLVAVMHWLTGLNVIKIYDFGAAFALPLLGLSLFYFGCPQDPINPPRKEEKNWVGLLMAFSFLYLSTSPVRWQDHYEALWNTLILLKPGHILSFIFLPILYYLMSKPFKWSYVVLAGLAFGAMILTFIVTAIFIMCGLIVYLIFIYFFDKINFKQELLKIASIVVVGLVFSSWWWWPIFIPRGINLAPHEEGAIYTVSWSDSRAVFDPLEATFFMQPLFWLGIIGIVVMLNRRRKGDLLILSLIAAMYLGKFIYPLTWILFQFAPQAWECSMFYLRPAMAMAASIGIYSVANYVVHNSEKIKSFFVRQPVFKHHKELFKFDKKASVIALCFLILTPYATPIWQNTYFNNWWSITSLSSDTIALTNWIKDNTPYNSVFLADGDTAMSIATYTGRKLMKDYDGRSPLVNFKERKAEAGFIYESEDVSKDVLNLLKKHNISYIVFTDKVTSEYPKAKIDKFEDNKSFFDKVYISATASIFKVKKDNL